MTVQLGFYGGVGTVTGSKYLLEAEGRRILIDCGLFQGYKQLRKRNWTPPPFDPASVDAVVLTHAHIDHSGYLPLLVREGFRGQIYATDATRDLCEILLPDSGYLQEREADFLNRHGLTKHSPALPLYTQEHAREALKQFKVHDFDGPLRIGDISFRFHRAGHILGAAIIEIEAEGTRVVFSGDLGRPGAPTMPDPSTVRHADYLVCESTYGDRLHEKADAEEELGDVIRRTAARGGTLIIPAFAVGRSQMLLYHIHRLKADGRIPDLPVYLDSPMAINATEIFLKHPDDHRLSRQECEEAFREVEYVRLAEDSKKLDRNGSPKVIISASGMATGGRVIHHLKHFVGDPRNTILFAGYQAGGTRGAVMTRGVRRVKIHGEYFPVAAEVSNLHMLSAHADADEIIGWLKGFEAPPKNTFITHGEPAASDALRLRISDELGWACEVPEHNSVETLT